MGISFFTTKDRLQQVMAVNATGMLLPFTVGIDANPMVYHEALQRTCHEVFAVPSGNLT